MNTYPETKLSKNKISLLLMAVPPFALLVVFAYGPLYGWIYAFYNYKIGMPFSKMTFVGLKYFQIAVSDDQLLNVLTNTLALSFLALLTIPLSAAFAILLSEFKFRKYGKFLQTISTLPNFMSWVIIYSVFSIFFAQEDGVINNLFINLNLISKPMNPLGNVDIAWLFQTAVRLWKEIGYNSIIFFAALSGIDQELYEAARIDGAGRFRLIRHITIPGLIPTIVTILLISVGFILSNGFDQFYVFGNPLVTTKLTVLDTYVYTIGLRNNDIPFATAISISKTIVSVALIFTANFMAKKMRGQSII